MSEKLIDINDSNFDESIASGITVVDFWAPWCGPCKMQTPILEKLVEKVDDSVTVAKVNVDQAPQSAGKHGIRAIPTILIFKEGEQVKQFVGVQQENTLLSAIKDAG